MSEIDGESSPDLQQFIDREHLLLGGQQAPALAVALALELAHEGEPESQHGEGHDEEAVEEEARRDGIALGEAVDVAPKAGARVALARADAALHVVRRAAPTERHAPPAR